MFPFGMQERKGGDVLRSENVTGVDLLIVCVDVYLSPC